MANGRSPLPADASHRHDRDLEQFDRDSNGAFAEFIGELATGRREQKKRQNKQAGAGVDQQVGLGRVGRLESNHDNQGVLEHIVIERA